MKRLLIEYRLEFSAGFLTVLGLLLLSQHGQVEIILQQVYIDLWRSLQVARQWFEADLPLILLEQPLSRLFGWLFILLAVPFVIHRLRYRFRLSERWEPTACPICDSRLHRIHRSLFDRLLSHTLFPGARRYECANPACTWSGIRRSRHTGHVPSGLPEAADVG